MVKVHVHSHLKKKKNFVEHCLCALFIDEAMEGSCSFESLVGSPCLFDRRDKHRSTEVFPLSLCNKDVTGHRSTWSFSGIESETDLILARVGIFSVTSRDLSSFNICPVHRSELSIGWQRNCYSNLAKFQRKSLITLKEEGNLLKSTGELARTFQNISISKPVSSFL